MAEVLGGLIIILAERQEWKLCLCTYNIRVELMALIKTICVLLAFAPCQALALIPSQSFKPRDFILYWNIAPVFNLWSYLSFKASSNVCDYIE